MPINGMVVSFRVIQVLHSCTNLIFVALFSQEPLAVGGKDLVNRFAGDDLTVFL